MKLRKLYKLPLIIFLVVIAVAVAEERHRGDAIIDILPADGGPSEYWGNIGFFVIVGLIVLEYLQVLVHKWKLHRNKGRS